MIEMAELLGKVTQIKMGRVNYVDFERLNSTDVRNYNSKKNYNLRLFRNLLGQDLEGIPRVNGLSETEEDNSLLIDKISSITSLSPELVEKVNTVDEMLNTVPLSIPGFGCTSIGQNGRIGQTMDLFTVGLSIVRESDCLYLTFPPYLSLLGMNRNLAFCTNFLFGEVNRGRPISHIRRDLLRKSSLDEVIDYLEGTKKASPVNLMVTDGVNTLNIESLPDRIKIEEQGDNGIAHTNHVTGNQYTDQSCPRLSTARHELTKGKRIEEILDHTKIAVPIYGNGSIGFGSIIKVVMDPRTGEFSYKEPSQKKYSKINV